MLFQSESELVLLFKQKYAEQFLRRISPRAIKRFALLEEFDSCNGVADLVLAVFRPYVRRAKPRNVINANWVTSLALLKKDQIISLDDYVALYGISCRTARKQLEEFVEADFIRCVEKNQYRIVRPYKPILESVISIEAKLHDWRRALAQAFRYKRFSNHSFVLLPEKGSSAALAHLDLFEKCGIGLMSLGAAGLSVLYCPPARERVTGDSYFRINEVAYARLLSATA